MGWFFSDYRVSPNFLLCWGWVVVEVGLGCDNLIGKQVATCENFVWGYEDAGVFLRGSHWGGEARKNSNCGRENSNCN